MQTVTLNNGESMFTESGGMSWMTENIRMETNTKCGLVKGSGGAWPAIHCL